MTLNWLLPLLFGTVVAAAIGSAVYLLRGNAARGVQPYLLAAGIGFWAAHLLGSFFWWPLWTLGELHLIEGVIGSLALTGAQIVRLR